MKIEKGAVYGADPKRGGRELSIEFITGPGSFFTKFLHALWQIITLKSFYISRNPDGLLPIIAVSYVHSPNIRCNNIRALAPHAPSWPLFTPFCMLAHTHRQPALHTWVV